MTSLDGMPILTAAQVRAAETAVIAGGSSVDALMAQAGAGIAEWVARLAGPRDILVLCGPGNNGGDGYAAASQLKRAGLKVRVAASGEPQTSAAMRARAQWDGAVDDLAHAAPASVVVDALLGTGLSRPLSPAIVAVLDRLVDHAEIAIAVDLPSGVATDSGQILGGGHRSPYDLTVALGAVKPAHLLQPSAALCGAVRVIDLKLLGDRQPALQRDQILAAPRFRRLTADTHKYSRGMVVVISGEMPGAAALAAEAALHAGAGYVLALGHPLRLVHAIVQQPWSDAALADALKGKGNVALVIGPGLGRTDEAARKLDSAIGSGRPLVIDGDALHLLDDRRFTALRDRAALVVLTPHAGEFEAMFGPWSGSKIEAARAASIDTGVTIVFKGADTVIARPDGTTSTAFPGSPWLSTAGTGDVLAGAIAAAMVTSTTDPAEAGVWLHTMAARRLSGPFTADLLASSLSAARSGAIHG